MYTRPTILTFLRVKSLEKEIEEIRGAADRNSVKFFKVTRLNKSYLSQIAQLRNINRNQEKELNDLKEYINTWNKY